MFLTLKQGKLESLTFIFPLRVVNLMMMMLKDGKNITESLILTTLESTDFELFAIWNNQLFYCQNAYYLEAKLPQLIHFVNLI